MDFSKRGFGRLNVSDKEFVRPGPVNTAAVNRPQPPSVPSTSTATEPEPEVRKRFVRVTEEEINAVKERRFERKTRVDQVGYKDIY